MEPRRYFIPQQMTAGWQLYGLSARHLLRLIPLPLVIGLGVGITMLLWPLAPDAGKLRMVVRALYTLVPFTLSVGYVGVLIIPLDAGRTLWDIQRMRARHRKRQTVFLQRRAQPPQP